VKAGPVGLTEGSKTNKLFGDSHTSIGPSLLKMSSSVPTTKPSCFLIALSASDSCKLEKKEAENVLKRANKYKREA